MVTKCPYCLRLVPFTASVSPGLKLFEIHLDKAGDRCSGSLALLEENKNAPSKNVSLEVPKVLHPGGAPRSSSEHFGSGFRHARRNSFIDAYCRACGLDECVCGRNAY